MYLRFAVHARHEDSKREKGLFSALYELRDEGRLTDYELVWFTEQAQWFNAHLKAPKALDDPAAIMWFKSTATEHIIAAGSSSAFGALRCALRSEEHTS